MFFVVPVAVALVFVAVLLAERTAIDTDLQIVSDARARPSASVAVRAFHFAELDRPEGPVLLDARGRVEIVDGDRVLSRAPLVRSAALGLEAVLEVPERASGDLWIRATAPAHHHDTSTVLSPLRIEPAPGPREARGRLALPLQRYQLMALRPEPGATPPAHLVPRVVGGACVPEVRCELLVLVGAPAASLEITPSGMVTPVEVPSEPTAGIVPIAIVTHGPEAELELVARRDGELVARRVTRLPIALASFALRLVDAPSLAVAQVRPRMTFDGVESGRGVIVDAHRDGLWERTGSIGPEAASEEDVSLPFEPLGPGTWRIQARVDPFSTDSAAVRMIHVRDRDVPADAALRELAAYARRTWGDTLAHGVAALDDDVDRRAAFILANPEMDLIPQPPAVSGAMQAATGLDDRRITLRWAAAAAMLLAGLLVVVIVMRRGLAAGAEARRIMVSAGDESADSVQNRRRMALSVLAAVLAIALAFVAAAALILARAGL